MTGRVVLSADGKSRSVNVTTTDSGSKKIHTVAAYDKQ
jgi:hypothetical protein